MYHNTKLADKMLNELSEFLRYTLKDNEKVFTSLEKVIEMIEKYLLIEKIRFNEKLNYKFKISPETKGTDILCFMLQPLIENAIKHGMKSSPDGLQIIIRTTMLEDWLNIEIMNTGIWGTAENIEGMGLKNIKSRLQNAYPNKHIFKITKETGWIHVLIKINTKL